MAALEDRSNYRRVWARDGCICGLAAIESGDPDLIETFKQTLRTLARHQGPSGQIPSNVADDGTVSYGRATGRVDATIWFLVGAGVFGRIVGDELVRELHAELGAADSVLTAWEHNDGGLIYVPQSGDWADEYVLSGYLLYDQVLRLWALTEWTAAARRIGRPLPQSEARRDRIRTLIADRYAPTKSHPWFCAGWRPGQRHEVLDCLGNAIACIVGIGDRKHRRAALEALAAVESRGMIPAFHPVIEQDDARYEELCQIADGKLRNQPGRYHNGGLWPMVTGFVAMAARRAGQKKWANGLAEGIHKANRRAKAGFHEYHDAYTGKPGGVREQAWSAAAEILSTATRVLPPSELLEHRYGDVST